MGKPKKRANPVGLNRKTLLANSQPPIHERLNNYIGQTIDN